MRGRATDDKKDGGSSQEHYLAPELAHQLSHDVGRPGRSQNCEDRVEQWVSVGIFGWSTFRGKVNLRQENRECGRKRNSPIRPCVSVHVLRCARARLGLLGDMDYWPCT